MKLLLSILMFQCCYGQTVFVGMGVGNTMNASVGFISDDLIVLHTTFDLPYSSNEKSKIFSINVGKQLGGGVYNVTPSVGIAHLKHKDFSEYDQGGQIKKVESIKFMGGIQAGKTFQKGRLFVEGRYCDRVYYSLGFKYFL